MATAFSESSEAMASESDMALKAFRVRVPASTSNCGPGFDTLGLAFELYNEVLVSERQDGKIRYIGNDRRGHEVEKTMAAGVARMFFEVSGLKPFGFSFNIEGEVPLARGLGSSVTVRAGILGGLNAIAGSPLGKNEIVRIVTALEGHPDNASAAVYGGFCVPRIDPASGGFVDLVKINVSRELAFAVISPDLEVMTDASRKTLPDQLPFAGVVKSLNSLAFLVSVFATGEYEKLRGAVTDFIHQPYRLPGLPGAEAAISAGVSAGGYTGWLSGSGSTVLCVAPSAEAKRVAVAMGEVFERAGISYAGRILCCDNEGVRVEKA